jgi:hypothetical protein
MMTGVMELLDNNITTDQERVVIYDDKDIVILISLAIHRYISTLKIWA